MKPSTASRKIQERLQECLIQDGLQEYPIQDGLQELITNVTPDTCFCAASNHAQCPHAICRTDVDVSCYTGAEVSQGLLPGQRDNQLTVSRMDTSAE
jgi:hypothetical protein